jgi:predicted DNA-binding WGR domain protein
MFVRLEKINAEERQRRFYVMNVSRTLFGDWCLIREWGRIGSKGGQRMVDYKESKAGAEAALEKLCAVKCRRGYHRRETGRELSKA